MLRRTFLVLALASSGVVCAADDPDDLNLRAALRPAPFTAQFRDPDYFICCGTMVRNDAGKCHLFYSRWPRKLGFDAWVTHSEIVGCSAIISASAWPSPITRTGHGSVRTGR